MREERIIYRRKLSEFRSWTDFSIGHVAFTLHRVTGWLLLGWVLFHLAVPALRSTPDAVNAPTSGMLTIAVLAVLVFHGFNGVRLILAELGSMSARQHRLAFQFTLVASVLLIVLLGGGL